MISIAIDIFKVKDIRLKYCILSEIGYLGPKLFDTYL